MTRGERLSLIQHAARKFGDKLAIIGRTGSFITSKSVNDSKAGFEAGMHAALLTMPLSYKLSPGG